MIGVVIPANDEADLLPACLAAVAVAAARVPEPVVVVVAADACRDATAAIARRSGAQVVVLEARCVGAARRAGTHLAMTLGADWIASTDADTQVDRDWLLAQRGLRRGGADAVCGTVAVDDWSAHAAGTSRAFASAYRDVEGHRHVHGANLGFSVEAYVAAGGWPVVDLHEDVELVAALDAAGFRVAWSAVPRVVTSARRTGRAAGGFADHLTGLAPTA